MKLNYLFAEIGSFVVSWSAYTSEGPNEITRHPLVTSVVVWLLLHSVCLFHEIAMKDFDRMIAEEEQNTINGVIGDNSGNV
jgi:uncharacterized membrane protein